jgi:hypothetical protein
MRSLNWVVFAEMLSEMELKSFDGTFSEIAGFYDNVLDEAIYRI